MKATKQPKLFGLILAGGYSKRLGTPKALLEFHGVPQVEYLFGLLQQFCPEVYLSKRKEQPAYKNFSSINDAPEFSAKGPLGGILSAMKEHPEANWLVVACDLPYVNEDTLKTLISQQDPQKRATAFISTHDNLPEPLCAIWQASAYLDILKLFNEGINCPRKVLIQSPTHLLLQSNPRWLDNINTPQEYISFKNLKS